MATIFPSGKAEGTCSLCNEHKKGLSLQLVSHTEAAITLAPMCASCVVGRRKPKPPRPERERELAKRYTMWKEMTKMTFEASNMKEERRRRYEYFEQMEKANASAPFHQAMPAAEDADVAAPPCASGARNDAPATPVAAAPKASHVAPSTPATPPAPPDGAAVYAPELPIDLLRRVFAPLAGDSETLSAAARGVTRVARRGAGAEPVAARVPELRAQGGTAADGRRAQRARRARCAGARGAARLQLEYCQHAAPPPRAGRHAAHLTHLSAPSPQGCVTVCSVLLPQRTALTAWRVVGGEGDRGASA